MTDVEQITKELKKKIEKVKEFPVEKVFVISGICVIFYFYNKFVKREYKEEEYEEEDYSNIVNNIDFKIYNIYDRR